MKDGYIKSRIIWNKEVAKNIYKMRVEGDFQASPGQFFMLRSWESLEPFLSRPISVNNLGDNYIDFLYEDKGRGTKLFSSLKKGDYIQVLGALGNGFGSIEAKKIALVGGGIGVAPLTYLVKDLFKEGKIVDVFAGFRDEAYEVQELKDYANTINIATESGSIGHKGFVTDLIDYDQYDLIVTCGPRIMMEKIYEKNNKTLVSMEERMACGIGACMGCNIETSKGNKKVCKDGPVFLGREVFFNARD